MRVFVEPAARIKGKLTAPADKSISHRAAILAAMADEPVLITNYLEAADTLSTLEAITQLGALVERRSEGLMIRGTGLRNAQVPKAAIDVGNAGTLIRLLPGWLAGQQGSSFELDGDASIRRRPIDRIADPLRLMGAEISATEKCFAPFTVDGQKLTGIDYLLPVASAQVKSCICLAALIAEGPTTITEPQPSRDHTERLLAGAGVKISRERDKITIFPTDELSLPDQISIPSDPSSAAFAIAAAVLVPGSRLLVENCSVNWTRSGFVEIAKRDGWKFVVVGDTKTPHEEYEKLDCIYLDPDKQAEMYPELSEIIGWKTIQRRNIGFVYAYNHGAEVVATVDDDNIPYDNWGTDLYIGKEVEVDYYTNKELLVFDPLSVTNQSNLWHRGFRQRNGYLHSRCRRRTGRVKEGSRPLEHMV